MGLGGHSEAEGRQKTPNVQHIRLLCLDVFYCSSGRATRGRPAPWPVVNLSDGVQWSATISQGDEPLPTLEQAGGLSEKRWSWHSMALWGFVCPGTAHPLCHSGWPL